MSKRIIKSTSNKNSELILIENKKDGINSIENLEIKQFNLITQSGENPNEEVILSFVVDSFSYIYGEITIKVVPNMQVNITKVPINHPDELTLEFNEKESKDEVQ